MEGVRHRAGAGEGRRDLVGDESGLAHAGNACAALALEDGVDCSDEPVAKPSSTRIIVCKP
jgi:hypothetical protein